MDSFRILHSVSFRSISKSSLPISNPLTATTFHNRVIRLSHKLVGKPLHPHIFRHMVATHAAQVWKLTPTELAAFLAHRNPMTLMKFYEVTDPAKAAARVDEFRTESP